ncbi:hypothetical protein STXM2123_3452 [Streptomyces sp. F-3]|nr:hypothetical protein STXM2123_3452 [Streptomyces sp. F-3]
MNRILPGTAVGSSWVVQELLLCVIHRDRRECKEDGAFRASDHLSGSLPCPLGGHSDGRPTIIRTAVRRPFGRPADADRYSPLPVNRARSNTGFHQVFSELRPRPKHEPPVASPSRNIHGFALERHCQHP